jgi:membrane carboxypeptidase/penicillin-binding protein
MVGAPRITAMRQRSRQRERRRVGARLALLFALVFSLGTALAGVVLGLVYTDLSRDLPSLEALPVLLDPANGELLQPTRLYDRTGEHVLLTLENPAVEGREFPGLDANQSNYLPPALISATLASADPAFWQHSGFTLIGLRQGLHPTLAQQLVSDLLLWDEPPGLRRSLRERLLASQVTARYGREKVIEWYLNSTYYGRLAYGAEAASRVYFGKPAAELSLGEAALLAATARSPALNPIDAPQAAAENQSKLLNQMLAQGMISAPQYEQAAQEQVAFSQPISSKEELAPAFARLVLEQLEKRVNLDRLKRGGLRVITSLDYDLQLQADCAARAQLARLAGKSGEILTADGQECITARLLPTLPIREGAQGIGLAANVVVLDPSNGEVLAMVGQPAPGLDPAQQPGHPAGTLISPFIALTAFTRGLSPATLLWDIPEGDESETAGSYHGPVRLRVALVNDYLEAIEQLLARVGAQNILETARQFGLDMQSSTQNGASSLLEDGEIDLLSVSRAYGVLANQGILAGVEMPASPEGDEPSASEAATILGLEDNQGRQWPTPGIEFRQGGISHRPLINSDLAYLATNVLSDEPARWASLGHPNPLEIGRPAAAKIGSTPDERHAWTVGYTPQILTGVWIGDPAADPQGSVSAEQAAALWHAIMQHASRDLPAEGWSVPPGISQMQVCNPSGLLPTRDCPDVVNEVFLFGTEPTQADSLYRSLQINRETGRLATVFTPPQLIDEQTYMMLPPEAEHWASLAGLPVPPEDYDVILATTPDSTQTAISEPGMLAFVKGKIVVRGSAAGDNFVSYRLQVGKGLNPQEWLLLGEDSTESVENGELGEWDTSSLDGLYSLQLLVVRQDQRVDSDLVQVTVDNTAPNIAILSPTDGEEAAPRGEQMILLAEASDNLGIQSVDFYIDDKLIDQRSLPPFASPWKIEPGEHTLRVVASDQAGNTAEAQVVFRVK